MVAIVVALSSNRVIGCDGALPWRLPTDLRRFRELTTGHAVVMGRRTYESLPDRFRPLPDRRNIVLSSRPAYAAPGAEVFADLESALGACDHDCFVIGGGVTYTQALARAQRVYATQVDGEVAGDAVFPQLPTADWRCVARGDPIAENGETFTFTVYERGR
jgi:dihydrofolate reductase